MNLLSMAAFTDRSALRRTARADLTTQEGLIRELRDQIEGLKEKDALRLEEIKL